MRLKLRGMIAVAILAAAGLSIIFYPHTLLAENGRGFLRFLQIITRGIAGIFPKKVQPWIARLIGLGLFLGAGSILVSGISEKAASVDLEDPWKASPFAEEVGRDLQQREAGYKVTAQQNTILLKDSSSGKELEFNLTALVRGDVGLGSPERMAEHILQEASEKLGKPAPARIAAKPKGAANPAPEAMSSPTPANQAAGSPEGNEKDRDLKEAKMLMDKARDLWGQNDLEGSMKAAEEALELRNKHLDPSHPLVKQTEEMLKNAKQMQKGAAK